MIFYFGTFNPIHNGHLYIANAVKQVYKDEVIFVPAYDSPWKPELKDTYMDRLNMLKLCNVLFSTIEQDLPTPSYTYQTVTELSEKYKPIKLIVGYDQFFSLPKWKNPETLKYLCEFIVIPREIGGCWGDWKIERKTMKEQGWKSSLLEIPLQHVSSSYVRECIKENKHCSDIPPQVYEYILKQGLYK